MTLRTFFRITVLATLALGQSHADWLFDNWEQRWGREKTIRLLEWNNQPAPTYARLNRLKTNAETLA